MICEKHLISHNVPLVLELVAILATVPFNRFAFKWFLVAQVIWQKQMEKVLQDSGRLMKDLDNILKSSFARWDPTWQWQEMFLEMSSENAVYKNRAEKSCGSFWSWWFFDDLFDRAVFIHPGDDKNVHSASRGRLHFHVAILESCVILDGYFGHEWKTHVYTFWMFSKALSIGFQDQVGRWLEYGHQGRMWVLDSKAFGQPEALSRFWPRRSLPRLVLSFVEQIGRKLVMEFWWIIHSDFMTKKFFRSHLV